MSIFAIQFILALILLILAVYICLYAMKNIRNKYKEKIDEGEYIVARVEDKVSTPQTFLHLKKHYIIFNERMYHLSVNEYRNVDVGKEYMFILSDKKYEILKAIKNVKLYKNEVTVTDVLKSTKIYKQLKK